MSEGAADHGTFFFCHLQKTAGTALLRRLRHHFGDDAVYPLPEEQGTPDTVLDVDLLLRRLAARRSRVEVVTGHFPLCVAQRVPGPTTTFTLLREPVERTLSFLRHQREVDARWAGTTLEEIYADPTTTGRLVTNHMVRMLGLAVETMTDGALTAVPVDDHLLESAQHNLVHGVEVLGLQEQFEPFCTALETRFGWDLGPPLFMNRTTPTPASDALRERIRSDNDHDVRLYRFAVDLCRRRGWSGAPSRPET